MSKIASPTFHRQSSRGELVLDVVFGLGALLLLLPAWPIIALIWLYDRLRRVGTDPTQEPWERVENRSKTVLEK